MVFRQKPLEKANFIVKMTGPAGQFWQTESAIRYGRNARKLSGTMNKQIKTLQRIDCMIFSWTTSDRLQSGNENLSCVNGN